MDAVRWWLTLGASAVGSLFVLIAAVGVLRMPDLYGRLQASSKAANAGAGLALLSCAFHFESVTVVIRAGALILFLFLTIPLAAHLIARAGHVTGAKLEEGAVIDEVAQETDR